MLDKLLSRTKENNGCLEWTGCFNTDGYPRAGTKDNPNIKVHRLVYSLSTGKDIDGLVVRHTCDNIKCINPDHLISGTNLDNIKDRVDRGRTHNHISDNELNKVKYLLLEGFNYNEIAKALGVHRKRIEYIIYSKLKF